MDPESQLAGFYVAISPEGSQYGLLSTEVLAFINREHTQAHVGFNE